MASLLRLNFLTGLVVFGIVSESQRSVEGINGELKPCSFPAVYNFGDSNSDTGGTSAAFSAVSAPNGETFFRHPAGRYCDGRLVIDFIAESLKLPYLSAYLDSIGTNFQHGANFATSGSSIRPPGYSPFDLGAQLAQFIQFKARTSALYKQLIKTDPARQISIPSPQDFSNALYTIDIGQNDLSHGFQNSTERQVRESIPDMLMHFSQVVEQLYKEGARFFWVHNTGPVGCLPLSSISYKGKSRNVDQNGCVKSQNDVAKEFNRQLKNKISFLRTRLPHAEFTYVDVYKAKYLLITQANTLGFVDPLNFCVGIHKEGFNVGCGRDAVVNGTVVYGSACKDPSRHISWDGIHYTEAANQWIAGRILNGSSSELPVSIYHACHHSENT